jgi:hypothetical protein
MELVDDNVIEAPRAESPKMLGLTEGLNRGEENVRFRSLLVPGVEAEVGEWRGKSRVPVSGFRHDGRRRELDWP